MQLNQISTFGTWLKEICQSKHTFQIPEYQRTYSWTKENANILLDDLLNNDEYFLGLLLLEIEGRVHFLIDGQQRFTTIFILLTAILKSENYNLNNHKTLNIIKNFIFYDKGVLRLSLQIEQNAEFFKKIVTMPLSEINAQETEYFSQNRLKEVLLFFCERINLLPNIQIDKILKTLLNSKILLHCVENTGQAMKIFELLNDRGKDLTQLETLKSFIMHKVYTNTSGDENAKQSHLATVKHDFVNIYKNLNSICNVTKTNFHEDDILRYYYIAFEDWHDSKDHYKVKENLKGVIYQLKSVDELKNKTRDICNSFFLMYQILEKATSDKFPWLKNLYILNRMATFYPLLISIEAKFPHLIEVVANYLELFTYRAFGIMNKRTNTALNQFYRLAQKINLISSEHFSDTEIITEIKNIINQTAGKTKEHDFENNLKSPYFYHEQQGIDGRYILIKYENFLQDEYNKLEACPITKLSEISNFESRTKNSLSVEHIVAQQLAKEDHEYIREITLGINVKTADVTKYWNREEGLRYKPDCFEENFLHCLGNLVISRIGANASKGDEKPDKKFWGGFKSQEEIADLIRANQRKRGKNIWRRDTPFNVDDILIRQERIIKFAREYWSFTYIDPDAERNIEERKPLI